MLSSVQNNKKLIRIQVPGTCGEWIQTVDEGRECLISLPINRFTILEVGFKEPILALESQRHLMPKSYEAFEKIAAYLNLSDSVKNHIHFEFQQRLEIGKGMASSTADIATVMAGVSTLVDEPISGELLLKLACEIEPSDGIMFEGLALVDHLKGLLLERFSFGEKIKILMLKPSETYNTQSMRTASDYAEKLKVKTREPLERFRRALMEKAFDKIGEASTLSLLENENILEKPYLEDLLTIAKGHHCYGLVGGHSGTVCGFLLHEEKTDLEKLIHSIESRDLGSYYTSYELVETYNRGMEIIHYDK